MKPTLKATLLLLATFTGGVLAGGAAVAVADRGDAPRARKQHRHTSSDNHIEFMTRRLDLTPAQRDSVQAILGRHKPKMDSIWRELGPRFETIKDSISNEIRRQLTPEQQTKYSEMLERFEKERRNDERREPKE
jgi:Spy/CpxP family protein refolding chaperone